MLTTAPTASEAPLARPGCSAPEDTDATVLLVLSRDTALPAALLEATFPRPVRLHLVRSPAAALAFLERHSPDVLVLDAAELRDGAGVERSAPELAFRLHLRGVPLVLLDPVGRSARGFLELCRARRVDTYRCDVRAATPLATAVHASIERRSRRLRFAFVLSPLAGTAGATATAA